MNTSLKKILFLLHLPPPVHGSSVVGEQIRKSKLIHSAFRSSFINLILSRKESESGKTKLMKLIRLVGIWMRLLGSLIKHKPDLCYFALTTTGSGFRKDVLLISLIRLFRVPILYHIHNRGIVHAKKSRLNDQLYRFVFKNTRVILLSRHLYYDVKAYVPEENLYYCPNGILDYQSRVVLLTKEENRPFRILYFSNLMKEKGAFVLVEACRILKEKGYHIQCDFVGGEVDVTATELNDYAGKRGLSEEVHYLGKRYGKLKEMVFEEADVFVLPTTCDCFPLVILEAMQHRLPVISYAIGGIADMVDDGITGYLLQPNQQPIELADRLEHLIHNPVLCEEMGMNGRKKYEDNFTLGHFERRLQSILEDVLA